MIDLRIKIISRLKKIAFHDVSDRDYALAYIDGEIVEAETHAECVSIYLEDEFNLSLNEEQIRPNVQIEVDDAWDDSQAQDLQNIYDNIKQICFGHVDNKNKIIYLEPDGLNISANDLTTIGPKIKEKYPDFNIVIDNAANENFQQVARLKKKSEHDTMNRDCAIVYVNGEFYQGNTHAEALNKYLNNSGKKLNETKYRPFFNVEPKLYYSDNDIQDINTMNDTEFKEIAFAHEVKSENAIYIEQYSLQNINIETVAKLFKEQYPSFNIYNDDNYDNSTQEYQLIARNKSRLKKLSGFHDKNNRTSAIMYLDGEVLEGQDHYDMITKYMKDKYNLDRTNSDQERETDNLFDSLSYAMGSKVDEDKAIYIDDDTLNNIDEQVMIDAIKAKYPGFNVIIETSSNEDMREYYKKYMSEEEYNEYLKMVSNY
jgi:hypothetical protein